MRCEAKVRSGRQCFNRAVDGSDFCAAHRGRISVGEAVATGIGVMTR
jgi:hypothetical protein